MLDGGSSVKYIQTWNIRTAATLLEKNAVLKEFEDDMNEDLEKAMKKEYRQELQK